MKKIFEVTYTASTSYRFNIEAVTKQEAWQVAGIIAKSGQAEGVTAEDNDDIIITDIEPIETTETGALADAIANAELGKTLLADCEKCATWSEKERPSCAYCIARNL